MAQDSAGQWVDITNFDFSRPMSVALDNATPELGMTITGNPRIESGKFKANLIKVVPESRFGGSSNIFAIYQDHCTLLEEYTEASQYDLRVRHGRGGPLSLAAMKACDDDWTMGRVLVQVGPEPENHSRSHFRGDPIVYPEGTSLWAVLRNVCEGFNDRPEKSPQDARPCHSRNQPESIDADKPGF